MKPEKRKLLREVSRLLGTDFQIVGSKLLRRHGPICFGIELETLPFSENMYRPTLVACSLLDVKTEFYLRRYFEGARVGLLEVPGIAKSLDIEVTVEAIKSQCGAIRSDCLVTNEFIIQLYRECIGFGVGRREMVFLPWISLINFQRFLGLVGANIDLHRMSDYVRSLPENLRQIFVDHYKAIVDCEVICEIEELKGRFESNRVLKPWVNL